MHEGSVAIRVKRILREYNVDEKLAEAIAVAIDDVFHKQFGNVATKDDIKLLIELMNKRFEDINRRFEDVNKRFEAIDRRFEELLHYVDKRFEAVNKHLEAMEKRFEEQLTYMNKRFDDLNKRLTFLQWLVLFVFIVFSGIVTYISTWVLPTLMK